MAKSPLFKKAAREIRDQTRKRFAQSDLRKMVQEVHREARRSGGDASRLKDLIGKYSRTRRLDDLLKNAMGKDLSGLVTEVRKYGRSTATRSVVNQLLQAIPGPAGSLFRALVSGRSLSNQFDLAKEMLEAEGFLVIPPPGRRAKAVQAIKPGSGRREMDAILAELMRSHGFNVTAGELVAEPDAEREVQPGPDERRGRVRQPGTLPLGMDPSTRAGRPRKVIDMPSPEGTARVSIKHPLVTGDFVPAVGSSNVHSYAYSADTGTLFVRFLDTIKGSGMAPSRRAGPGPLYKYYGVTPREFVSLHKAASKGKWVWDKLRIRGTKSGHRKDYRLVGVSPISGYVPRKATLTPDGEWYEQRRLHAGGGKWLTSSLSSGPAMGGLKINRAQPNRAAANDGRPPSRNTGRPK